MTFPRPELVDAARLGDRDALDALVSASMPLVYNLAGRALHRHSDVDDVVRDTMLRVIREIRDIERPADFRPWLVSIALSQVRTRTGSLTRSRSQGAVGSSVPDFAESTILRLRLTDQRRRLAEATRWLDPDDRELLSLWWLKESGHLDNRDLAIAFVAARVHRLKRQLDTARVVADASAKGLADAEQCPALRSIAQTWDGTPSPAWREQFHRHIRGCEICGPQDRPLIPLARLLRDMPLVPVPVALHSSVVRMSASITPVASVDAFGAGHAARAKNQKHRRRFVPPAPLVVATVTVAALGVLAYAMLPGGSPTLLPLANISRPASPTTPEPTSPSTDTATPPPSTTTESSTAPNLVLGQSSNPSQSAGATRPASARPGPTAPFAAPDRQTSSRKGVGASTFDGDSQALAESGASWFYTWSANDQGISAHGVGFVPMVWGSAGVTSSALAQARQATSCGCMLAFNEPDNPGQSDMSPDQALALWPQLQATGLELGAPAVATDAATAGGWLDRFIVGAKKDGYRVDFIPLHWYGSDFDIGDAVNQLRSYVESVHNRYRLPIWLTEFALTSFANGRSQYPSESTQAAFLTAAAEMLDSLPYVQRYAWFGLGAASGSPGSALFQPGPDITPVGAAFATAH